MRCQYCGNQIKQGQMFCDQCGAQVGAQSEPAYYSAWADQGPEPGYGYGYGYGYGNNAAACEQKSGGTATTVVIGIVVGIVCLMMVFIGFFFIRNLNNTVDATTKTLTEAAESDDSKAQVNVDRVDVNYGNGGSQSTSQVEYVYYYDPYFEHSDADLYAPDAPDFFWDSSDRYLCDYEVCYLNDDQLQRAINDIYARNGLIFTTDRYQAYYESQCWYYGDTRSQDTARSRMNCYEVSNIELLRSYQ